MQFSILERLMLFNMLPAQGDFTSLKAIRQLKEDLTISEEEQEQSEFVMPSPGDFKWAKEIEPQKDIFIPLRAMQIIKTRLQELDEAEQLTMQHYSLYERFIGSGDNEAAQ